MYKKMIAFAISAVLTMVLFSGCSRIFQPSCTDIAKANYLFFEEPIQVKAELDVVNDELIVYYSSTISCCQEDAAWEGKATVFYNNTYFEQECISQRDSMQGAKLWRGQWAEADTASPVEILQSWLSKVESGACIYEKTPVVETICGEEVQVYQLILADTAMDWNKLCDADMDSLFGGKSFLGEAENAEVILLIDAKSLLLRQVRIAATEESWRKASLTIEEIKDAPLIQWNGELHKDPHLNEEWNIKGTLNNESNQAD